MLPEAWLKRYGLIASIGDAEGDVVRFARTQVGLLDALLAGQAEATWDEAFDKVRRELRRFEGVEAEEAPEAFTGELRPYQREGLGWFSFLRRFGFGGCLADDMGLGKTVQVLALLAARVSGFTETLPRSNPSLVVVPKSLVFNWQQEAQRFTPGLRVLDHTGIDRVKSSGHLGDYDVILTTYGTLRRDAVFLKDVEFDYVILDEAQAVKNPASESAKAVRLVKGRHRLALSGTPVQNHLGDLWSLFDFLNPGMLGGASVLADAAGSARSPDEGARQMLGRALRPFILRRTKEQVASDLPPKVEQTIYCELEAGQRKIYDELREYYRRSLLEQVDRDGLNKSKMQILEALLRLRQAALHPGLLDKDKGREGSAKLDMLMSRLEEVIEEGHKALVFSQFTSMLALVRERLDAAGVVYEYLDGKTRDREARVGRFQSDAGCKLFLISLKAGGLGLNLTAADYVFLLDPWWNPAVEAQAIDRAHRIGQDKQVFACRLIARDTVEEKVLALQQTKRDLADAIINADNSLIRSLGREDLELLLS
jgi:SNF2 family DNA or RNA helicase